MPTVETQGQRFISLTYHFKPYAKSILAFAVGGALFVLNLLTAGAWNAGDTYALVAWIGTTLGVFTIPNNDTGKTGQVN